MSDASHWFMFVLAELTLWDQDLNEDDQIGDPVFLLLKNLQLDKPEERTLKFGEVGLLSLSAENVTFFSYYLQLSLLTHFFFQFSEVDIILEAKKV